MINIQQLLWENVQHSIPFKEILKLSKKTLPIKIECGPGSIKWNSKSFFWYGEFPNHINPADGMGWDIITIKNPDIKQTIQGVVCISPNAKEIPAPNGNKPGNHKLILSDQVLTQEEKDKIKEFFKNKPQFKQPVFFDEQPEIENIDENWEKSIMNGYKLGHMKDEISTGIAVGPTARKQFNVSTGINVPSKAKTK